MYGWCFDGIAPKRLCAVALIPFELSCINRLAIKLHDGMVNDQQKSCLLGYYQADWALVHLPTPSQSVDSGWEIRHSIVLRKEHTMLKKDMNQALFEKHLCNQSSHWKIRTISIMKGSHHVLLPNGHLLLSAKMNGTKRRTLVSPWRMHCTIVLHD